MSIEQFFTTNVTTTGQKTAAGHQALSGNLLLNGFGFMDLILARMAALENEEGSTKEGLKEGEQPGALQSNNPLLAKTAEINISEIIAANPEIAAEIEKATLDPQGKLSETLALNQQAFDQIIKPIIQKFITTSNTELSLEELPQGGAESFKITEMLLLDTDADASAQDNLTALLNKINEMTAGDSPAPGLISLNLTPEQIASLKKKLTGILSGEAAQQSKINSDQPKSFDGSVLEPAAEIILENIESDPLAQDNQPIVGVATPFISLISAPSKTTASATNQSSVTAATSLPAQLNAIVVGEPGKAQSLDRLSQNPQPFDGVLEPREGRSGDFEQILKDFGTGKKTGNPAADMMAKPANAPAKPSVAPNASMLQAWPFTMAGSLFAPIDWTQELGLNSTTQNVTSLSNMTNLVTQAQQASQPHPATQMVAATIQKSTTDGQSRNILLQLDPPELGRVEIEMNFTKDKSVKANIIAEKPETYMMLQRDAHVLERVLQDAGLDAEGGLNFELAQDGHEFENHGRHDGQAGQGSTGDNAAEESSEIIESTMTWHVDPDTGHMRFDMVV